MKNVFIHFSFSAVNFHCKKPHINKQMVQTDAGCAAVSIRNMAFKWPKATNISLQGISLDLPTSCRCILVGSNGAGKSCILRTIGGLYSYEGKIEVHGKEAFRPSIWGSSTTTEIVAGLNVWRNEDCVLIGERWQPSGDSKVSTMLDFVDGWVPERRDMLIDRFGVDMDWRVNQLSDGRKRRVQLLLAFARPATVLLLDEVTTDLDVLARQTLLDFLREESEERGVTVLMSTHIFDGLESWGTHIAMVAGATVPLASPTPEVEGLRRLRDAGHPAPLFAFVEAALRAEKSRVALSAESVLRPDAN